jgi:hypothetical protein
LNTLLISSGPINDMDIGKINANLTNLTLYDAMSSDLVNVTINGTFYGFWGQCIDVYLEQLTAENVTITIAAGVVLIPADSGVQNMIVAKTEVVELTYLGDYTTISLYAFCGESADAAPGEEDTFTVSITSYGPSTCIGKILAYFETNDTHLGDQVGQLAIWACLDGVTSIRLSAQAMGIDDEVNTVLVESGTGLSLTTTTPMIPGFETIPIFIGILFAIGIATKIRRKRYFN